MPKITICIPTYNRRELVCDLLSQISEACDQLSNCSIIVSDNLSDDGSYEALLRLKTSIKPGNLLITQNDSGGGFYGNIANLVRLAKGEYVLFLSDEDRINPKAFQILHDWLETNRNSKPLFVNAQFKVAGVETRDCGNGWLSSDYISGLVFHTTSIKRFLLDVLPDNISKQYYPHPYLAFKCMLAQECIYLAPSIIMKGAESSVQTFGYIKGLGPRLAILSLLLDWLEDQKNSSHGKKLELCRQLQKSVAKMIVPWAIAGSKKYGKEIYSEIMESITNHAAI